MRAIRAIETFQLKSRKPREWASRWWWWCGMHALPRRLRTVMIRGQNAAVLVERTSQFPLLYGPIEELMGLCWILRMHGHRGELLSLLFFKKIKRKIFYSSRAWTLINNMYSPTDLLVKIKDGRTKSMTSNKSQNNYRDITWTSNNIILFVT